MIEARFRRKKYEIFRKHCHYLKGSSLYVGAVELSEAAKKIQLLVDEKKYDQAIMHYPKFVEMAILTKIEIKKFLSQKLNCPFQIEDNDYNIPLANGYKIVKEGPSKIRIENQSQIENENKEVKNEENINTNK